MLPDATDGMRRKHRWGGIVLGILMVIWLPIEDTNTFMLMSLSAGLAAWLGVRWWLRRDTGVQQWKFLVAGLLIGLVIPLIAMVFIAIKAGLHAHGYTDFAPTQLRDILFSAPWWGTFGLIAGYIGYRVANNRK